MTNFDSLPFLQLNEQSLSLGQVLRYLQLSGRLLPFMQEILTQHVIIQEIQARKDLQVNTTEFEQAIIEFRLKHELTNADTFQKWLARQGMDNATFQNRVVLSLKLDKLKAVVAAPDIESYFAAHQQSLEEVELSFVVVAERDQIDILGNQLRTGAISFEQLATEHALGDRQAVRVMRGKVRRSQLPDELQSAVKNATPGELVGPLSLQQYWCLFQLETVVPATLTEAVKQDIQNRLFQQWLANQVKGLTVKLDLGDR